MGSFASQKQEAKNNATLTMHAAHRMHERNISLTSVDLTLTYGRKRHERGATIYAIGRKEVSHYRLKGIDLSQQEGLQVLCNPAGGIVTVYRNHDFSKMRSRKKRLH